MFVFLDPDVLWMMLLPSLFLLYLIGTNMDDASRVFKPEMLERLRHDDGALSRTARNVLFFLALLLMIVALARPVIEKGTINVESKGYDVVIAIDMSASMLAKDVYPSRMEMALKKTKELVQLNQGSRIGVVGFSKNAFVISPLTQDSETVHYMLENINTDTIKIGSTKLISALGAANLLLSDSKQKALILITDGGNGKSFENEIEFAKEEGISIYVIGIGTEKGSPIEKAGGFLKDRENNIVIVKLNEAIKSLATESGGAYTKFAFSNADSIAIWEDIAERLKKEKYGARQIKDYQELFYYPLGAALLLLLLAFSSIPRRKETAFGTLMLTLLLPHPLEAGLLDFMALDKAREAYELQNYDESTKQYEALSKTHKNSELEFNLGDSYYKKGEYQKAYEHYQNVVTDDKAFEAQKLYNMGNTQMMQGDYKKAQEYYEKSLTLKEDADAQHNLDLAKRLQKEREQQSQNQPQDNQQNQDQNDQKEQQQNQDKQQNKNQQDPNKDQQDPKEGESKQNDQKQQDAQQQENNKKDLQSGNQGEEGNQNELKDDPNSLSEREAQKWLQILKDQKTPTKIFELPDRDDTGIREEKEAW